VCSLSRNLWSANTGACATKKIPLTEPNLFIGTNASGKSAILDALRFLHEGVLERDFKGPVFSRGGIVHLAWKGEEAREIELLARFNGDGTTYEWLVRLTREGYEFSIQEDVSEVRKPDPPIQVLWAKRPGLVVVRGKRRPCLFGRSASRSQS
jgi:predicted ATPase